MIWKAEPLSCPLRSFRTETSMSMDVKPYSVMTSDNVRHTEDATCFWLNRCVSQYHGLGFSKRIASGFSVQSTRSQAGRRWRCEHAWCFSRLGGLEVSCCPRVGVVLRWVYPFDMILILLASVGGVACRCEVRRPTANSTSLVSMRLYPPGLGLIGISRATPVHGIWPKVEIDEREQSGPLIFLKTTCWEEKNCSEPGLD